jgi:hypothetical protein
VETDSQIPSFLLQIPENIRSVDTEESAFELTAKMMDMPNGGSLYDMQQCGPKHTRGTMEQKGNFIYNCICLKGTSDDDQRQDFNKAVSGLHAMISAQIVKGIKEKRLKSGILYDEI